MKQNTGIRILCIAAAAALLLSGCRKVKNSEDLSSVPAPSSDSDAVSEEETQSEEISSAPPVSSEEESSLPEPVSSEEPDRPAAVRIEGEDLELPDFSEFGNTSVTWGPGHQMDELNRSTACLQLQKTYGENGALFLYETEDKKMYLTFDEGYENGYTEKILDVLKEKECPAVFFVTLPYARQNPELIQRMIEEGHVIGNHSSSHPADGMPSLSVQDIAQDIAELHNYMVENYDYQMTWFRPPAGLFSVRSLEVLKYLGYTSVMWSFAYNDWNADSQPDPTEALQKITTMAHPGGIPLLHAVSSTNAAILGDAIDAWREAGYELCRME